MLTAGDPSKNKTNKQTACLTLLVSWYLRPFSQSQTGKGSSWLYLPTEHILSVVHVGFRSGHLEYVGALRMTVKWRMHNDRHFD